MNSTPAHKHAFTDYLRPKTLAMLLLGFSSGLPFLLVGNTFGYWLRDEGTSLAAIGFLSWVGLAYSLKFLWAPVLDRTDLPLFSRLGHRRGWMLAMQILVGAGLSAMALGGVGHGLVMLGVFALVVAFASATQDTAIDAWRIESADDSRELGLLTSAYQFGYRIAMLVTDALILFSAQHLGWRPSYAGCGVLMLVGIGATLFVREPAREAAVTAQKEREEPLWSLRGLFDAIAGPFIVFFKKFGAPAIVMLVGISLFQLPNFVMGPMANPLYHDIGLSKDLVAAIRGSVGLIAVFLGIVAGGFVCARLDSRIALAVGGTMQIVGTAAYAILPYDHGTVAFATVMGLDNFGIAMAGVTLVTYMSSLTSLGYTATQYAFLTSTYTWAGKILKGFSGIAVQSLSVHWGLMTAYALFFLGAGAVGIPAILLFLFLAARQKQPAPAAA